MSFYVKANSFRMDDKKPPSFTTEAIHLNDLISNQIMSSFAAGIS